jgi:hypothetical protein
MINKIIGGCMENGQLFDTLNVDNLEEKVEEHSKKSRIPYDVVSYFYKSLRIGDAETAMRCAALIRKEVGERYVAHTLLKLLGEDCSPDEWQRLYPTISEYQRNSEAKNPSWCLGHHDMWECVYAVAKAKKWYQTEEGIELEKLKQKYNDDSKVEPIKHFPEWVWDFHTYQGKAKIKNGTADLRLDGRWEYRFQIQKRWEKLTKDIKDYSEKVKEWIKSHYE